MSGFDQAMESVPRISWRRDPTPTFMPPRAARVESESEDARLLQEALDSGGTPPILDHPEYIEGWVGVAGRRFLPNLRNGIYSIQGYIDLHGLSRVEAREAVEEFITRMSRQGSCCVKIIHGRGINSPSDKAVLKEHLQRWLATRRMSHHVVHMPPHLSAMAASEPSTSSCAECSAIHSVLSRIIMAAQGPDRKTDKNGTRIHTGSV